ncbi:supporter of activation of yellow protein isoform X2 [Lucilia sericata]|uniref:supporter of activation of yellow protein isoform X2 n=1 Tax=Lucilia sericata TaxID=13632 RepID=UPI0018A83532|nr:supporter of activation of yellow protein isoform X2 [Lucilia sericata]
MNVTNRRKSTDADTPTTQSTQQQQQQQQLHHQQLLSFVSCRQAATATTTTRNRQEQLQPYQQRVHVLEEDNDDQEQVVTSTSSDCLLPLAAEGEGEEVNLELEALVTSPARITSSTNNYEILTYNSDSLSLEEMVMPSTSDNSSLHREGGTTSAAASSLNPLTHHLSINTRILKSNNDMVARDTTPTTVAEPGEGGGGGAIGVDRGGGGGASTSSNTTDKIILKLPKTSTTSTTESQLPKSLIEDDLRKVEPLKINLHNTHHTSHHTPKITIKPIVKETSADILMSSEECSSSAEDEMVSKLNASEPHIVPKLTIRAKNEEHSTIVPKLTIKINDSNNTSSEGHSTQAAANTPPLPKLTIKTGQDGHTESIITNISPASSTTSSSSSSLASCSSSSTSTNSHVATNSSSSNTIPKLTIKPLQKSHEAADNNHPTIPKLCIKGNMICGEVNATTDDATTSKIPKLTIKTGQEHAVIITQHNDHTNAVGGIPKLTIKTKSLDSVEDSNNSNAECSTNEKIPKITIKTNSLDSPNIVASKRKSQLETNNSPLSPKQAVPKLTITRQQNDMVVTNKHTINTEDECTTGSIPKMTIKTQSKIESVPKLTIKNISSQQQRPPSTEESGLESEAEDEGRVKAQTCKTVPKLTIKNLGSPQQKLTVVQETPTVVENKTNAAAASAPPVVTEIINANILVSSPADTDEFADLLTVDNAGESSNSQGFCGFNDNTADSAAKVVLITADNNMAVQETDPEIRRNSDDMDIDEDLQTDHEPQIFQNDIHFKDHTQDVPEILNGKMHHPKLTQIIDTVDLTSSPSRSCSPAQFDYNDDSNSVAAPVNNMAIPSTNILLERLQRETTVIQNTQQLKQQLQQQTECNVAIPPPLQPKPNAIQTSAPASLKYPQLAERLMANGTSPNNGSNTNNNNISHSLPIQTPLNSKEENIIDSIEILDTPEGSPRNSLDECPQSLQLITNNAPSNLPNGLHYPKDSDILALNNNNSNLKRHLAGQTNQANHLAENNMGDLAIPPSNKQRRLNNDALNTKNSQLIVNNNNDLINQKVLTNSLEELNKTTTTAAAAAAVTQPNDFNCLKQTTTTTLTSHQRARKQKHEHLLPIAMEEVIDAAQNNSNDSFELSAETNSNEQANENATPFQKRRGRPKKSNLNVNNLNNEHNNALTPQITTPAPREETPQTDSKSRRVQLLRKRLAIDMVDADEPLRVLDELESSVNMMSAAGDEDKSENHEMETQKRLRTPLRASRRSNTPTVLQMETKTKQRAPSSLAMDNNNKKSSNSLLKQNNENVLNNFLESNSSISSSACSNSSTTLTSTVASITATHSLSMATQIDLTMSSSSSNSNGSTTNTITTVEANVMSNAMPALVVGSSANAVCSGGGGGSGVVVGSGGGGGSSNNSMLPPTTILSSSDPLPDVVFKPNDFSSILATQQLRAPMFSTAAESVQNESQDEDMADDVSGPDNSGDDSASSSSMSTTPGRGRGRGRASRGGRGRGYKAHRLGRNASAVSKAIAMNRPRCVGALKHTPDPDRIKGLYSPSPSVFEEDTRMSADLTQNTTQPEPPQTPTRQQPDFLNNEESQSSIISNTSILDPNNVAALQNGSAVKKPMKRKKMEVCVAEDAELTVASIAEYDWPPPKGCCPSKNRDTFMIQEQVALYLGIKSFKRKYPDLPRRQIDMEERNYLQEKSLVSEKMCDLGITAVWASDILDIMYTDFYDKYEEYKDFVRQKHLREIEAKQKSLGLNVAGRGLQARERAMLSASKWNAYFNRTRKEERLTCLDLQTFTVNKPSPAAAPIAAIPNRPIADAVARAAKAEKIPQPPTLMKERVWEPLRPREAYYPLSLVPGQFCEKYYDYSPQELRQFPLNTVLEPASHILPQKEETTDTDSAAETIDFIEGDKTLSNISASERLSKQRHIRRIRAKHTRKLNNAEFKVPLLPGAVSNSSTESCSSSSSDDSSSESDSETSSCTSSSSDDSSEDENSPATCGVCQHPQNRNLKDIPELFVQCYTCRRKVHPSCIEMPHRMANRVRNYNWQCADCKCCIKCKRKHDQNKMLFCEQCDRGFHIYCLTIKAVPDGRWSCERCSICMRCGATKPEGLPIIQPNGEKLKVKHRKLKWINEYRIDHVTKLREHCSMLCVPCGRAKHVKRVHINTHNNTTNTYITSPGSSSSALSPSSQPAQSPTTTTTATTTTLPQISPNDNGGSSSSTTTTTENSNVVTTQMSNTNTILTNTTSITSSSSSSNSNPAATAKTLESKDSISLTNSTTPQNNTNAGSSSSTNTTTNSLPSSTTSSSSTTATGTATTTTTTTASGGAPPVVA